MKVDAKWRTLEKSNLTEFRAQWKLPFPAETGILLSEMCGEAKPEKSSEIGISVFPLKSEFPKPFKTHFEKELCAEDFIPGDSAQARTWLQFRAGYLRRHISRSFLPNSANQLFRDLLDNCERVQNLN